MALVNLDLVGSYAINQGYEWKLNIFYPGNALNGAWWGQIWSEYAPGAGLEAFSFGRGQYDATMDRTKFEARLNTRQTKGLIPTGAGYYYYEMRFTQIGRSAVPVLAGKVHVLPTFEGVT